MTTPLAEILLRDTSERVRAVLEKSIEGRELSRDDAGYPKSPHLDTTKEC